ncbi:MAG: hypothetical protein WBL23_05620 [Salinisphaera sp.]
MSTILANQPDGPLSTLPDTGTAVLPKSITDALASGDINRVPVIEGTNATGWRPFTALAYDLMPRGPVAPAGYLHAIEGSFYLPNSVAQIVASRYPVSAYHNPDPALSAAGTVAAFACPARREIALLAQHVPTYAYEFADPDTAQIFIPPVAPVRVWPDAFVRDPVCPRFHIERDVIQTAIFHPCPAAVGPGHDRLLDSVCTHGKPECPAGDAPFWPAYSGRARYMSLVPPTPHTLSAGQFANEHECGFWDQLANSLSSTAAR